MINAVIKHCLCFLLILCPLAPLSAASTHDSAFPPKLPDMNDLPSTQKSVPVTEVTLGTLPVKFEITSLLDVKKATKRGRILHRGDAGESEYALCYTIAIGHARERIWLSSGELGGPEHSIESFYATAGSHIASNSCPALPTRLRPVSISNSLWLGQKASYITRRLGQPSVKKDGWWLYSYSGKASNDLDVSATFGAKVANGIVVGLFVNHRNCSPCLGESAHG
jgi:hypothetical protein